MPHLRRRHDPREPKELDRGAGQVSGAQPGDCCRRSQEAWRARLSLDDRRYQALPPGLRSAAENRDVRPGAVRSDDGAVSALGGQSVVVDVRVPAAITYESVDEHCLSELEPSMNSVHIEQKSYEMPPRDGFTVTHFITVADIDRSV